MYSPKVYKRKYASYANLICVRLSLLCNQILTTPRLVSVSTKYVTTNLDDGYSGTLSITVAVEC